MSRSSWEKRYRSSIFWLVMLLSMVVLTYRPSPVLSTVFIIVAMCIGMYGFYSYGKMVQSLATEVGES